MSSQRELPEIDIPEIKKINYHEYNTNPNKNNFIRLIYGFTLSLLTIGIIEVITGGI